MGIRLVSCRWLVLLTAWLTVQGQTPPDNVPAWRLVWADEFDQADGTAPNPTKWTFDTGGGGWGNNELQSYTTRRENSYIQDGQLVIEVRRETYTGSDNLRRNYTSARLKTQGKVAWNFGRIEGRLRVPAGQGIWPAFWTLGLNIGQVGWPDCGEIDIMENIGREPSIIHGTVHGPGFSGGSGVTKEYSLSSGRRFSDDFHVFAIEWETNRIRWFVDERVFFSVTPSLLPNSAKWVFNAPQFLLLNVAVGGNWPGSPDATTVFPQRMYVDYVRVYTRTNAAPPVLQIRPRADNSEACWTNLFPQAWLEGGPSLTGPWMIQHAQVRLAGGNFVATVSPGFYRLRW